MINISLLSLLYYLEKGEKECSFVFKINQIESKKIYCGLYTIRKGEAVYIGKLKKVTIDKKGLLRIFVELSNPQSSAIKRNYLIDFVLGKYNTSYTWITIQEEKTLYHSSKNYKIIESKVDSILEKKLRKYINKPIILNIISGEQINNININNYIEEKYKDDLNFRLSYYRMCSKYLLKSLANLSKIKKNCDFIYVHNIILINN